MTSNRPSVSRDTRWLLEIVLVSIAMLWVLARLRFPDRVPTPNPVPPVLAQLTPASPLDDIAASVAQLEPRLAPLLVAVDVEPQMPSNSRATRAVVSALRFRDDLAVALLPGGIDDRVAGATEIARDAASQLVVVRVPGNAAAALSTWTPRRLPYPRFLIGAAVSRSLVSFRPVFIGSLQPAPSPTWRGSIWTLPPPVDVVPGTFLFTMDGALAGLSVEREGRRVVVPADAVLTIADRLAREGQSPRGHLGIDVQPLTPALAAATGATAGVIVTWVDPQGPAAGAIMTADVVERIDDQTIATPEYWRARVNRLKAGDVVALGIRRGNENTVVPITAGPMIAPVAATADRSPGLTLRTVPKIGASIARVDEGSPAARAGLEPGDVLTLVGDVQAPTAAQAARALAAMPPGRPVIVAFTRAGTHRLLTIERTW
jgi:hypothetical protein